MQKSKIKIKASKGFTLIEALVFLFIFVVTTVSFYSTFTLGINYILETKMRLAAIGLANEKMEIVRSLEYETIGTQGSVDVPGDIDPEEDVTKAGRSFHVLTQVGYKDDEFDGLISDGTDARPNDYKHVRITVSWAEATPQKSVSMTAIFAAPGIEPPLSGGILSINILDNAGNGISGATIKITNTSVSPNINDTKTTESDGNYLSIGSPQSNEGYELEISKPGYFTVRTYPPYSGASSSFVPVDVHASVINGALSTKTIITDRVADININAKSTFDVPVADVEFDMKGGRKIGEDTTTTPVTNRYAFEETSFDTDSSGAKEFSDMSSGVYFFEYMNNLADYEFIKMEPNVGGPDGFNVLPGGTTEVDAIFADKNINSLLVKVINNEDESFVPGATVQLKNEALSFDVTLEADENGYAYFPTDLPELAIGQYELKVTAVGYTDEISNVDIDNLIIKEVKLIES